MNRIAKRLILTFLSLIALIAISAGLLFLDMIYGRWWDRPALNVDSITEIKIYEGHFRVPGQTPDLILYGKSGDTKKIISAINKGWYYWQPVKLGSGYQVDIFYSDSKEGYVYISSDIVSVRSAESGELKNYRIKKQVRPIIDEIIKTNPNQTRQPTSLPARDEAKAQGEAAAR